MGKRKSTVTINKWPSTPPKSQAEARRRIAEQFGVPEHGAIEVEGPDGVKVQISVDRVVEHSWKDHPERWSLVPLIPASVAQADFIYGPQDAKTDKLYAARVTRKQPGKRAHPRQLLTWTGERGAEQGRRWKTTYADTAESARGQGKRAGGQLWPPANRNEGRRNPAPTQQSTVAARPGRPTVVLASTPKEPHFEKPTVHRQSRNGVSRKVQYTQNAPDLGTSLGGVLLLIAGSVALLHHYRTVASGQ